MQKFRKAFLVSDLAQNVSDVAGIGKRGEMKRAISHAIVELKRNMEATFCSDQDSQADNGTTLPYLTRGMGKWITNTAQGDQPVPAAYLTPAASIITKTTATTLETDFNAVCGSIYAQTGQQGDFDLICGTAVKQLFSTFAAWVPNCGNHGPVAAVHSERGVQRNRKHRGLLARRLWHREVDSVVVLGLGFGSGKYPKWSRLFHELGACRAAL